MSAERSMVVWCPDWPVRAAAAEAGLTPDAPIALVAHGLVHACSSVARAAGVHRGLKLREAQSRCATLTVLPLHPDADARRFEPVLTALEAGIPTVQVVRPGLVVLRASGPARYFGGERAAAEAALGLVGAAGVPEARVGIADGPFAAEQAARTRGDGAVHIVPQGDSPAFLAPMPVGLLGMPQLVAVLAKLGIRTLGAFAALGEDHVRQRFGPDGVAAHRVATGLDPRVTVPRTVPPDRQRGIAFEPPLERIDQIAFAMKRTAEDFVAALAADLLVCTALAVEVVVEAPSSASEEARAAASAGSGARHRRVWLHPRSFTPLDVIDRVRWQLQGAGLEAAVTEVRLTPAGVDAAANHEQGLWGGGPDERIHHALSRVQSLLGHESVLTATVGGGRLLADRRVLSPWGERRAPDRDPGRPWPGSLPGFSPSAVLTDRPRVAVLDPAGAPVEVDDRGTLSGPPATFVGPGGSAAGGAASARIEGWAGPWPLEERWWDQAAAIRIHRMQAVCGDGSAWLLAHDDAGWWAEARYD